MPNNPYRWLTPNRAFLSVLLLAVGAWALYFATTFRGPGASDTMTDAALARNIAAGRGLTTSVILPYELAFHSQIPFPELRRPLLQPLMTALLFKTLGPSDFAAVVISIFAFLLSLPVLFYLTKELFGQKAAILATVIYGFHAEVLLFSISGLTETLFSLLLLLSFLILAKSSSPRAFLLLGLVLGLASMARDVGKFYAFAFLAYALLVPETRRRSNVIALVAGFVIPNVPFWIRTYFILGNPFLDIKYMMLAGFSDLFPEYSLEKSLVGTSPWPYIIGNPGVYLKKLVAGLEYFYYTPNYSGFNVYLLAFFLVGMLRQLTGNRAVRLKLLLIALIAMQIAISTVSVRFYRYLFPLLPLTLPFVAEFLLFIYAQWLHTAYHKAFSLLFIVGVLAYPYVAAVQAGISQGGQSTEEEFSYITSAVQRYTAAQSLVMSDRPQVVAWYGNRVAMHIPYTLADLRRIDQEFVRVDAIALTEDIVERYSAAQEWHQVFQAGQDIPGFSLVFRYQEGTRKLLLYTRESRQ